MAFRETQSAIVIDTLIADLVHEAIDQRQRIKDRSKAAPCQRLYDILGIMPCSRTDEEPVAPICTHIALVDQQSETPTVKERLKWHSWLIPALADDSSGDEFSIYRRNAELETQFSEIAVQTEQPRLRLKRLKEVATTAGDPAPTERPPCERNRQTIFIDAVAVTTPTLQNRPPLADRFCYMLTDFASALYCSLAIMCCCTPSMFR